MMKRVNEEKLAERIARELNIPLKQVHSTPFVELMEKLVKELEDGVSNRR